VKAMLLGFKDDRGEPFHLNSIDPENLVILAGPLMESIIRFALEANEIGQTTNVLKNSVKSVMISNYITSTVTDASAFDWSLAYTGERNRPWVYSRFRQRTDQEIQDAFKLGELRKLEGFEGTSMDDLRELSSVMLETNLGKQGANAEVDVMQNERFLVSGRWRGEILPGEPRNMIFVNNAASS
jgi:hypothetical protein